MSRLDGILVPAVLLAFLALGAASVRDDSPAYDEPYHLGAGVSYLATGDYRLAPDHPPGMEMLQAALALPAVPPERRGLRDHPDFPRVDGYSQGRRVLFGAAPEPAERARGMRILGRARWATRLVAALGAVLVFAIARLWFGPAAARAALLLCCLSPTWLAHGNLVTTDAAAAVFIAGSLLAAAGTLGSRGPRAVACGVAAGCLLAALFLAKYSALFVLPALAAMALTAALLPQRERPLRGRLSWTAAWLIVWAIVVVAAIWAAFGGRYCAVADPAGDEPYFRSAHAFASTEEAWDGQLEPEDAPAFPLSGAVRFARDHRLLPEAFLYGLAQTHWNTRRRSSFLMGEVYERGRIAYFPIAFAVKTPLATALLLLLGLSAARRRIGPWLQAGDRRWERPAAVLLAVGGAVFCAVYLAISLKATINIGHRHLLPLVPWLLAIAGGAFALPAGPWLARVRLGAIAWLALLHTWTFPHYLSYFNEFAPSAGRASRILVDSNLDWGQDLWRLGRYQEESGEEVFALSLFGTSPPEVFGIRYRALPSFQPLAGGVTAGAFEPGTYAISETQLASVYLAAGLEKNWDAETWRALRELERRAQRAPLSGPARDLHAKLAFGRLLIHLRRSGREPDDRVGETIRIYRLDTEEMQAIRREALAEDR